MIKIRNTSFAYHSVTGEIAFLSVIVLAHFFTYFGHYSSQLIFPWDFQSAGYHAQTAAWFRDGSIISPPTWMPYGSMGFPAWWAVQSSAWYLPLQVLYLGGFKYDFFSAAAFQAAHVLIGSIGIYLFARVLGAGRAASCVAALVFHFSSIFFSNAQHVDIIRASALLPILLLTAHPKIILRNKFAPIIFAIVLFQYLVAGYPGNIVAGFYTFVICVIFWFISIDRDTRILYSVRLSVAGLSGVLLAQVKYFPFLMGAYSGFKPKSEMFIMKPEHFWTFLFRHDMPLLPQDITMQSLWSPPVAIVLFFFVARPLKSYALPMALLVAAIGFGMMEQFAPHVRALIPGFSISRMPHSDWRPTLHISFAIFSALIFANVRKLDISSEDITVRMMCALASILAMSLLAISAGYKIQDINWEILILCGYILVSAVLLLCQSFMPQSLRHSLFFFVTASFVVCSAYMLHSVRAPKTWVTPWVAANDAGYFGAPIADLLRQPERTDWPRRPARETYGADQFTISGQFDLRFNRAWYAQEFATFGYDNLRSREFLHFVDLIDDPAIGRSLLEFMTHPGQAIFFRQSEPFLLNHAAACSPNAESCAVDVDASADIQNFGLRSNRMSVTSSEPVKMVENEMYYAGWSGDLCSADGSCAKIQAAGTDEGLRYWNIPAGSWVLTTRYETPFFRTATLLAALGFVLMAGLVVGESIGDRRRAKSRQLRAEYA